MFSMTRIFTIVFVCFFAIACQSGDKENANATTPNTAESPLIIPNNTAQTTPNNGAQTTPTGLQDIWVLDSINNIAPDSNYFAHGTPVFDLNLEKKTFSGHTGCNGMNGKFKVEGEKLFFKTLDITKSVCKDKGFEKKLLKAFNSPVSYKILNDKLYLTIDPSTVYVFRRIRRS